MPSKLRIAESHMSLQDYVLQPSFKIGVAILGLTIMRAILVLWLFPIYLIVKLAPLLLPIVRRTPLLLSERGRQTLVHDADSYRTFEEQRAAAQLRGEYRFTDEQILSPEVSRGVIDNLEWRPGRESFEVEGVKVSVVHEQPEENCVRSGKKILLLHGNPSWSYMWRHVIDPLVASGHEVFALDWIGHGASDKPVNAPNMSFELHMRTLQICIIHFDLAGCFVAAHDWGGCIALCTIPNLPSGTVSGIFLLNTFFPPRPSDISLYYYLLYLIWFFSTGIFNGYIPEWMVMRYMAPEDTSKAIAGYCAPYSAGVYSKASVGRFAHIVPGTPDFILDMRGSAAWRMMAGIIGPASLTNFNAQASLAKLNMHVRNWWSSGKKGYMNALPRVYIAFGENDPLLKGFKSTLEATIGSEAGGVAVGATWIPGAGHYPVEEKPEAVAHLISQFVEQ